MGADYITLPQGIRIERTFSPAQGIQFALSLLGRLWSERQRQVQAIEPLHQLKAGQAEQPGPPLAGYGGPDQSYLPFRKRAWQLPYNHRLYSYQSIVLESPQPPSQAGLYGGSGVGAHRGDRMPAAPGSRVIRLSHPLLQQTTVSRAGLRTAFGRELPHAAEMCYTLAPESWCESPFVA